MPITDPVFQFTVLVTCALAAQLIAQRLHLPAVTGLLVLGMLLGPGGLGVLPEGPVIELLGEVGMVYVMFLAGLEVDLRIVRTHRGETVTFGLLAFGLSFAPTVAVALALGYELAAALLLGALLSSHTLLAYPIVRRLGLLHRRPVVTAIGGTLLTDTLALMLLAVLIQVTADGGEGWWGGLRPLVMVAALVIASLWILPRLAQAYFQWNRVTRVQKSLGALAVLLILASATELMGTKHILGAFLAGICLNGAANQHQPLREHIEFAGSMFFIPFFFISTGMLLELEVFTGQPRMWLLAALLITLVFLGKSSASWLTGMFYGYSHPARGVMIGLTLPQAAATLAVAITAQNMDLLGDQEMDAVIILIFVTSLAGPLVTRYAGQKLAEEPELHEPGMQNSSESPARSA